MPSSPILSEGFRSFTAPACDKRTLRMNISYQMSVVIIGLRSKVRTVSRSPSRKSLMAPRMTPRKVSSGCLYGRAEKKSCMGAPGGRESYTRFEVGVLRMS